MGYFKRRREQRKKIALTEALGLLTHQSHQQSVLFERKLEEALVLANAKRFEYENNVRENLEHLINNDGVGLLVEEVAQVIDDMSKVYGYRIAKGKRIELAQDILVALSVKK
jgi:hypothetical protein